MALAGLGDFASAEAKLRRSREIEPRNAGTIRVMGLVCEWQNKLADALGYYREALSVDPSFRECEADRERVVQRLGW